MPRTLTEWKVLPHSRLSEVEPGILTVTGDIEMPVGTLKRRMTVVRLRDARLVIYSAIALDEPEMKTLEDYGTPAFMIVPNDHHRMDAKIWRDRYPAMRVIAPPGVRDKVAEVVPVDATRADFGDPDVTLIAGPGTREHELALTVRTPEGTTLVLNDIVANMREGKGFGGWLMHLMGFGDDEARVPLPAKMGLVKDKDALAAQLRRWADLPRLRRILVSHGETIEDDPPRVLRGLAHQLA